VCSALETLTSICKGQLPGQVALSRLGALDATLAEQSPSELQGARVHELLTHVVNEVHAVCVEIDNEILGQGAPAQSQQSSQ
jgi:hypothetical protein